MKASEEMRGATKKWNKNPFATRNFHVYPCQLGFCATRNELSNKSLSSRQKRTKRGRSWCYRTVDLAGSHQNGVWPGKDFKKLHGNRCGKSAAKLPGSRAAVLNVASPVAGQTNFNQNKKEQSRGKTTNHISCGNIHFLFSMEISQSPLHTLAVVVLTTAAALKLHATHFPLCVT